MDELRDLSFSIKYYLRNVTKKRKTESSHKYEERWLSAFHDYFLSGKDFPPIRDVTLIKFFHLELYQSSLLFEKGERKLKISAASVNRQFNTIRHFFTSLVMWDVLPYSPMVKLKDLEEITNIRRPWNDFQYKEVFRLAAPWFRDVLVFLRFTGARAGGAEHLKWENVNFEARLINVKTRKGRAGRETLYAVPIIGPLKTMLTTRYEWAKATGRAAPDDHVFLNASNNPVNGNHLSRECRRLIGKAGLSDQKISLHGIRHHLATRLHQAGASTETIRKYLGHSNTKTTERYLHAELSDLRNAAEKAFQVK